MKKIELNQKLEMMLISAERYACGRRSYIVGTTVDYLTHHLSDMSDWCLDIFERDVSEHFAMAERSNHPDLLGDECDQRDWNRFLVSVRVEKERRTKSEEKV